ncbi:unnamed protein product [Phaeothamnion confervicola]
MVACLILTSSAFAPPAHLHIARSGLTIPQRAGNFGSSGDSRTRSGLLKEVAIAIASVAPVLLPAWDEAAAAPASKPPAKSAMQDEEAVMKSADLWLRTVTSGRRTAPRETAALYASDAALWGTVSAELRDTPLEIRDYFDYFAKLKNLRVSEYKPLVRVYNRGEPGAMAINSGYYTFTFQDKDGKRQAGEHTKHARYSFTYRREPSMPYGWAIVDHHSSVVPTPPATLRHAN